MKSKNLEKMLHTELLLSLGKQSNTYSQKPFMQGMHISLWASISIKQRKELFPIQKN